MGKLKGKGKKLGTDRALSDLPACLKVAAGIRQEITENYRPGHVCYALNVITSTESTVAEFVKQVSNAFDNDVEKTDDILLKSLFQYFMIANTKSPIRSIIASMLEHIKDGNERHRMIKIFSAIFHDFLNLIYHDFNTAAGRHTKDLIMFCATGVFILGQDILMNLISDILSFLDRYLFLLTLQISKQCDGNLQNDVSSTLKCTATVLKKVKSSTESDGVVSGHVTEVCRSLLKTSEKIFEIKNLEWDCYSAVGMTYVAALKMTNSDKEFFAKIKEALHLSEDNMREHYNSTTIHQRMSICNAIMIVLSHDGSLLCPLDTDKCAGCEYEYIFVHSILPCLKDADKKCKLISDQVIVAKCFARWSRIIADIESSYHGVAALKEDIQMVIGLLTAILEAFVIKFCSNFPVTSYNESGSSHNFRECLPELNSALESREFLKELLDIAMNKLEHPTDAIRHQANDMLVSLLKIGDKTGSRKYLEDLLDFVLHQNWQKRSTFISINCLMEHVSAENVFLKMPDVMQQLLVCIANQSLAPYASETYRILAEKLNQQQNNSSNKGKLEQWNTFIVPLLDSMCQSSMNSLRLLINYCFIKLLKVFREDAAEFLILWFKDKLLNETDTREPVASNTQTLASFLHCLMATVKNGTSLDKITNMKDLSSVNLMKSSLVHQDDEIRHLAFALLCESNKPSNLLQQYVLEAIQYALPFNMTCQDPAFRQKLLNSVKKLLLQLKGNFLYLEKCSDSGDLVDFYQSFLHWLCECTISQLHPDAPYPKRMTCVNIFLLLVDIFVDFDKPGYKHLSLLYSADVIHSLFVLLSDPYPDVRESAFILLSQEKSLTFVLEKVSRDWLTSIYSNALERAYECSQPENCADASFHLRLYAVLTTNSGCEISDVFLKMCSRILDLLEQSLSLAKKNLYVAASTSPMYGLLHCMKNLLRDVNFNATSQPVRMSWREQISQMISICFRIAASVLPVVGSVSPEGHLPEVESQGLDEVNGGPDDAWNELPESIKSLIIGESVDEHDERSTRAVAQQILVCCWRSAKESSLLLQEVSSMSCPLDSSENRHDGVLSFDQLLEIGEHLKSQLMEARHRGAFEIAYYVFKAYCPRLWNNKHSQLNCIPEKWLLATLSDIEDPLRAKELCATRRSAGLPFFMQALLSSNKTAKGRSHLQLVMSTLLKLCEAPDESNLVSKVHSLNILRGLVKDSCLGEEILPFLSQCIMVALTGFNSGVWAVRNSSTLLFSALFTRTFGVKRDKDDSLSLKNRLSGNDFFSRLPGLHSFLTISLEKIIGNLEKGGRHALNPMLHPILLLLSRVYPSTMQSRCNTGLEDFIPLLIKCRACAVYKSRVAASSSLASIASWDQCLEIVSCCCKNLVTDVQIAFGRKKDDKDIYSSPQNRIHGGLLQIKELLLSFTKDNSPQQSSQNSMHEAIGIARQAMSDVIDVLLSKDNKCSLTKSMLLELFLVIEKLEPKGDSTEMDKVVSLSLEVLNSTDKIKCSPGHIFLLQTTANLVVLLSRKLDSVFSLLEDVILNEDSEKLYFVLQALHDSWEVAKSKMDDDGFGLVEKKITNALLRRTWNDEISTLMYRILSKCVTPNDEERLLKVSFEAALICNPSQSRLLVALIEYQTIHIASMLKREWKSLNVDIIEAWIGVLSLSSRSFENTDDVRLAVANSIFTNCSVCICTEESLSSVVLRFWKIVISLLCDEESDIRKVASHAVCKVKSSFALETGISGDQPNIDTLALHHAVRLLVLSQGERRKTECKFMLESLLLTQAETVPLCKWPFGKLPVREACCHTKEFVRFVQSCQNVSFPARRRCLSVAILAALQATTKQHSASSNQPIANEVSENSPKALFERSQTNTYFDAKKIREAVQEGLKSL